MRRSILILLTLFSFSASSGLLAAEAQQGTVIPGETIVVSRFGIYPTAITQKQGTFSLYILNRLPDYNESFQVVAKGAEPNQTTPTLTTAPAQAVGNLVLTLSPGEYQVRLAKHPLLVVDLTITN